MARKVFFSFHYKPDNWRASQVRNIGAIDGNQPVSDNDWEGITRGGDPAIETWIDKQMSGRSCAVVLIGSATAGRKWITYEISKAWNDKRGIVGVYIHNLKGFDGKQCSKGANPFASVTINRDGAKLSTIVKAYDPPYTTSTIVYDYITDHIERWVDEAIAIREGY
jgi:hypothetical protein